MNFQIKKIGFQEVENKVFVNWIKSEYQPCQDKFGSFTSRKAYFLLFHLVLTAQQRFRSCYQSCQNTMTKSKQDSCWPPPSS